MKSKNVSVLSDLSNVSGQTSANSTLNDTQAKKIAALAKFKQLDMDVTARTALKEFNKANLSDAQTPALLMPKKTTRKRKAEGTVGSQVESQPEDLLEELDTLTSDDSSLVEAGPAKRKSLRLSRSYGITMSDVAPERDPTKPTSVSVVAGATDDSLQLDETENETMQVIVRTTLQ